MLVYIIAWFALVFEVNSTRKAGSNWTRHSRVQFTDLQALQSRFNCLQKQCLEAMYSGPSLIRPSVIQNTRLSGLDLCPAPCCVQSKVAVLDRWNTQRCQNFDRSKPEKTEIWRLFAPMMDNMTGKATAVLIMIHYRCYLHDDSHIRLFHLSSDGPVPL